MSDYLDPNNEELLKDFFVEAQMSVELLEQNILAIENNPDDGDAIDEIFRAAHTLKGAAATVQMAELAGFTHLVEDLLDEIRSHKIQVSERVVDLLLSSIDTVKIMLEHRTDGNIFTGDISGLKNDLEKLIKNESTKSSLKSEESLIKHEDVKNSVSSALSEYEILEMKEAAGEDQEIICFKVLFNEDNPMNTVGGIQIFSILKSYGQILRTEPDFDSLYEDKYFPEVSYFVIPEKETEYIKNKISLSDVTTDVLVSDIDSVLKGDSSQSEYTTIKSVEDEEVNTQSIQSASVDVIEAVAENNANLEKSPKVTDVKKKSKDNVVGSILRVDSKRIDNLLNLVSETVINKAAFNQISNQFSESFNEFRTADSLVKSLFKNLVESIPQYIEDLQSGMTLKDIKKQINENYTEVNTVFDSFETNLKVTVDKFRSTAQNLGRTTGELHEGVLRIRMVPISQIFSRFPRLVRDMSKLLDKNIKLIIDGEDTELDKSVIEDLLDPLMHCVRNSLDHGIESKELRQEAGKPEEGHILLKASNEGNMIVIEVSDDGAGIDIESVKKKAIDKGIIHPTKVLSDIEAFNLIFEPGFSTAKKITNISGRGVGLDVVRRQIEKLNGNVSVWSEPGSGSRFTIKIPLTLAIIQGLLVRVGKEIYAIPITSVIESHRIKPSDIKMIDNYEVFNVRSDVISLMRLNNLFGIPSDNNQEYNFIVIVGSGDKKMGLMVDSLIGEEDVVIKPLKDQYTNSPGIAGATILRQKREARIY